MVIVGLGCWVAGIAVGWVAAALYFRRCRHRDGKFLAFVGHEINTPLTALNMTVLNFTQGAFGPLAHGQEDWMRLIKEQVSRLGFLLEELRDFIHMEYIGDFQLLREPLDLEGLLRETITMGEEAIRRSGTRAELKVAVDLPKVSGDGDRLRRAMFGLLSHARKFRVQGPIQVVAQACESGAEVEVVYQGPPLRGDQEAGMLQVYYPVDCEDQQTLLSVGLGLGFCRRVIEAHGGSLSLHGGPDGRIVLRVRLPQGA